MTRYTSSAAAMVTLRIKPNIMDNALRIAFQPNTNMGIESVSF